jgi:hypothetical protein
LPSQAAPSRAKPRTAIFLALLLPRLAAPSRSGPGHIPSVPKVPGGGLPRLPDQPQYEAEVTSGAALTAYRIVHDFVFFGSGIATTCKTLSHSMLLSQVIIALPELRVL